MGQLGFHVSHARGACKSCSLNRAQLYAILEKSKVISSYLSQNALTLSQHPIFQKSHDLDINLEAEVHYFLIEYM